MTTNKPRVVRAVHASPAVHAWYRRELQSLMRQMFEDAAKRVRAVYRRNPPQIGFAHDDSDAVVTLRRSFAAWGRHWERRLNSVSRLLAKRFANKSRMATEIATKAALRDAGFTVRFQPTAGMISAYRATVAENVALIKSIGQKFHTDVQSQVWSSVMKGHDVGALTKGLQKEYGVSYRRAALIARDQNNKAKAIMEEVRRSELGITEAIWQHSHGGRVPRPTHVAMDGKKYDIRKGMWDSAAQKFVWPGTEINCRCTSRSIVPALQMMPVQRRAA